MVGILIPRAFMSRLDLCLRTCRSRSKVCQKAAVTCVSNLELFNYEKATHLNPIAGRPWSGGRAAVPLSANLLRQHLLVLEHDWDYPLSQSLRWSVPVTPMVSMGAVQQWPTVQPYQMPPAPVLNPFAPVVPAAAAGYMPYTYGYYTYASTSSVTPVAPVVPTAWGGYTPVAPQGAVASRFAVPVPLGLRP